MFEAARWAPSSSNQQPWSFVVATRDAPADFERLLGTLADGNRQWARHAPVLVLSVAKLRFEMSGGPNRHAFYDVGQAVANLTLQAASLGLVVHQMAGFDGERARELFELPEGYEPVTVFAMGYPGDAASLPKLLQRREARPRSRKRLEEFVFSGSWGRRSPLVTDRDTERKTA
jgi:nitroreductase